MKSKITISKKLFVFLTFSFLSISMSFGQAFPPPSTSCSSKDLEVVAAKFSGGNLCNSCATATSITRTLTLSIHNSTGSIRGAFAFWGTLEIYSGTTGLLLSSVTRTGCGGPLPGGETTSLDFGPITYNCGDIVKISNLWQAWTTPGGVCPLDPNNISPKCGKLPTINVNGGVNGEFILTESQCGAANGTIDLTPTGGTGPYSYSWTASGGGVVPAGQQTNQDLTGLVPGTYSVLITDANSCTVTKTRTITATTPAVATFATTSNITVPCGGATTSSLSYTNGVTGGCLISGSVTSTLSSQSPAGVCGGTLIETWIYTDPYGRTITKTRIITVSPAALPTMTAPSNTTVACGSIPAATTLAFSNGLSAGCLINGTSNPSTFSATPSACGGTVTETWTATDLCGRQLTSVSRTITVSPAALPTMTAPSNTNVTCGSIPAPTTISFSNGLSGGCEISGTSNPSTFSATPSACGGTVTETWTATDSCGRALASVSRTITLSPAALPTMTAPLNTTVACGSIPASSTISFSNGLTGGCEITGTSNPSTFSTTPSACGGTITETWTATDSCGRALASVSRTITVSPAALPTMTAPINTTVACGSIPAPSTISFSNGLSGGCEINGTSNPSTFSTTPSACGGTVTETWTATDSCGRALVPVSRTITVSPAALPTMTAPLNTIVACGSIPAPSTISFSNGLTGGCEINGTSNPSTFSATPSACGGTVTETWTATDLCGRQLTSVSRTITVSPAALPTMTAPSNTNVTCGSIPAPTTISFSNGLSGGCEITGTSNPSTFSTTPSACGGTVTETWTATDSCGRALVSVSRTITLSPATLPTMTAPLNTTVACGSIPASSTISFSNGLTGGCEITGTSNPSTFSTTPSACGGTVTETWTATDSCGRALASVSRTITVSPAALPTMTAPINTTVACGSIPAPSTISFSNGLSGGCEINGTSNPSTFSTTPSACGGTVTETWTATDSCGRALASVSRTITVSPAALPTMTAPLNTIVACGSIPAPSTISFSNGLTGSCAINGISNPSTFSATPPTCGGTITETWTAIDSCGRTLASVSRIITVSPAALPTMPAPAPITISCGVIPTSTTISFSNGLSGNCSITGTSNPSTFVTTVSGYCNGKIVETWTATDSCGRELTPITRTITVDDTTPPNFSVPGPVTVNTDANCNANLNVITTGNVSNVSDNCDPNPTVSYVDNDCYGNFNEGSVNAGSGNYFNFNVTGFNNSTANNIEKVALAFDTNQGKGRVQFTLVSPSGQGVVLVGPYCNGGNCDTNNNNLELYLPVFYPNSSGHPQWNNNNVIPNGVPINMTPNGNLSGANTIIGLTSYVSSFEDLTGPMNGTWFVYAEKVGSQLGSINFKSVCLTPTGSCPNNKTITRTWTVTDVCGNSSTANQTINIQDVTAPNWDTTPGSLDRTIECSDNTGLAAAQALAPTATDNCSGTVTYIKTSGSFVASSSCPNAGTYTNTWIAKDVCNNTSTVFTQVITIQDTTAPLITTQAVNTIAECDGFGNTTALQGWLASNGGAVSNDSCSNVTWTNNYTARSNNCGATGTASVTFTATDACGNASTTTASFTIVDTTNPTITTQASNISIECNGEDNQNAISIWLASNGGAVSNDSCSEITWSNNFNGLSNNCSAAVSVTFTATDACGNASTTTASFTVVDTTSPTISVQASALTVECDGKGNAGDLAAWLASNGGAASNDTCSNVTWTNNYTALSDGCGQSGTASVTFTATDACGNNSTTTASFTVLDTTIPTISLQASALTVECDGQGNAADLAAWLASNGGAISNDTCSEITWSNNYTALSDGCGQTGTASVTFTATDACGNASSTTASFTIADTTGPTISTQASAATVECDGQGNPAALAAWLASNGGAVSNDTCSDITWTNNYTALSDDCGSTGTASVTFTATDACGNASTTTANFTIIDTTNPTISTQSSNISVECNGQGNQNAISLWLASNGGAVSNDTCSEITWSNNFDGLSNDCSVAVSVTFTATDACGNASSTTASFTIADTTNPIISSQASALTVECDGQGNASDLAAWLASNGGAAAADACSEITWSNNYTALSDDCGSTGTASVTFTATDACGNASSTTASFTIADTTNPTISTQTTSATVECDGQGNAADLATWLASNGGAVSNDTCSDITWTNNYTALSDDCGSTGTASVTFTATDACGNASSTTASFTIADTTNPTISTQTTSATVECDGQGNAADLATWLASNGGAVSNDTCSDITWTNNFDGLSNDCSAVVSVTFTATDACGNASTTTASFTVTDNTNPTISTQAISASVECDGQGNAADLAAWLASNGGAAAADACSNVTWTNNYTALGDGCGQTGTASVTFTATDACGNASTTTASFTIVDTTNPTISAQATSASVECDGQGNAADLATWLASNGGAVSNDTCSDITWTNNYTALSDDCGSTGTASVTFTATDACGNASTTTASFTIVDTTNPTISAQATSASVECDGQGNAADLATWLASNAGAVSNDTCSEITWTNNYTALSDGCGSTGSASVTFTATDACGNASTTTASFTIADTTNPIISSQATSASVECDGQGNAADLATWLASNAGAVSNDTCSDITWTNNYTALSDDCGSTGTASVTFTATDACGNASTTTASFTIADTTNPTISAQATSASVECDGQGNAADLATWLASNGGATSNDTCSEITWSNNYTALSDGCGQTGTASVTFTATDACGNASTTTASFTIVDTNPPTFDQVTPSDITLSCDVIPDAATLTATDTCSTATVVYNQAITNVVCAGTYTITRTWTATDACGNGINATQIITVEDNTAPTFDQATPAEISVSCDAVPTAAVLTASDNCGTATVVMTEVSTPSLLCPSTYTIVRTWTATDLCQNPTSVSQTINVSDSTGPFIIGNFDVKVNATCDAIPIAPELTFGDNCSTIGEPVYTSETSEIVDNVYTITRTWVVTDACGNTSTFIQYVIVTQTADITVVNDIPRCNDSNDAQVDLESLLPVGTTENGTWDFGNLTGLNGTILSPLGVTEGIYTVSYLITEGICPRRIDINVNVIFCSVLDCGNVIVHNAFTPNNDAQNLNEFFNIENIADDCHLPNSVEIFNRWGILVYETDNYDNSTKKFTGISEGRATVNKSAELPTGTYFYIIKYSTSEGTKVNKNGYLYLTR